MPPGASRSPGSVTWPCGPTRATVRPGRGSDTGEVMALAVACCKAMAMADRADTIRRVPARDPGRQRRLRHRGRQLMGSLPASQESRNRIAAARPGRTCAFGKLSSSQSRGNRRRTGHAPTRSASQVYLRRTSGLWRRAGSRSWVRCLRMPMISGIWRRVPSGSLTSTVEACSTYRNDRFNRSPPSTSGAAGPSSRKHPGVRRPRTTRDLAEWLHRPRTTAVPKAGGRPGLQPPA